MLVGVDEAGRGPVLGSMFIAAVGIEREDNLPNGIRDSKTLPHDTREELATRIAEAAATATVEVTPDAIDAGKQNLNQLTLHATARAVRSLLPDDHTQIHVIADACDPSASRYRDRLARNLPDALTVEAFHEADGSEPIVGAASIIAKSARERQVDALHTQFGDVGSGYPSDPRTRAFLRTHVEQTGSLPACARESWKTSQDVLGAVAQGSLTDF